MADVHDAAHLRISSLLEWGADDIWKYIHSGMYGEHVLRFRLWRLYAGMVRQMLSLCTALNLLQNGGMTSTVELCFDVFGLCTRRA